MIEAFRKIWRFAGNERKNINKSVAVGFLNAVLQMFQVAAIYFVVLALTGGEKGGKTARKIGNPKIGKAKRTLWPL